MSSPTGRDNAERVSTTVQAPGELRSMLKIISNSTDARSELVHDIREQVDGEDYLSEEKLNLAIYRLLKDILD